MQPEPTSIDATRSETIEELFCALESPLLMYALRLAGERELAEDLVQEAFMRLHARFSEVNEPRRWLYRTVHNLALNQRRSSRKVVPLDAQVGDHANQGETFPDPQPLPDEQLVHNEGIGFVRLTVDALDAERRELVRLKFAENLSYKEISARTGLTVGNVGYQLHHLLKALGEELTRNGILP